MPNLFSHGRGGRLACAALAFLAATASAWASSLVTITVPTGPLSPEKEILNALRYIALNPTLAITDEQKQRIADDLAALAEGIIKPSSSSVEQLADDLAAATATGHLSYKAETILVADLEAVFKHSTLTPARLQAVLAEIQTVLSTYSVDPADVQQVAADLASIIDGFETNRIITRQFIQFQPENVPPYLPEGYLGGAKLVVSQETGQAARVVLSVGIGGVLTSDPYTVAVTKRSDGSTVLLGKVKTHVVGEGTYFGPTGGTSYTLRSGHAVFGGPEGRPLPEGLDLTDVDLITITDGDGVERLTGSFADPGDGSSRSRLVNLRMDAGAGDADAAGSVSFRVKVNAVRTHDAFLLYVGGLPANAPVTLVTDGVTAGTFTTTAQGRLIIAEGNVSVPTKPSGRMLPVNALPAAVDLSTVNALSLTDAAGNVLASGSL